MRTILDNISMADTLTYTVGGTIRPGVGLYVARNADKDLFQLCRKGEFAYVLSARQVGKSSLMVRTAAQLKKEEQRCIIIDLNQVGTQVDAETWYVTLLTIIADELTLDADIDEWWRSNANLGVSHRLIRFFQEFVLANIEQQVTIFIDEIDITLSLDFTDDFFAAIRYLYNKRAQTPEFSRLSFVLIGVATPGDLMKDANRTPFNIGQRVDVTDFTFEEALPLVEGLGLPRDQNERTLDLIMHWTRGHPYLTQRLCQAMAERARDEWREDNLNDLVAETFFGPESEHDHNLRFVGEMLTKRADAVLKTLLTYKEIRYTKRPLRDEEQSPVKNHLKLSGIVRRENGKLHVRNRIYKNVFDRNWLKEHWPVSWFQTVPRGVKVASAFVVLLLITSLVLLFGFINATRERTKAANTAQENARLAQERLNETLRLNEQLQSANKNLNDSTTALQFARLEAEKEAERATTFAEAEQRAANQARQAQRQTTQEKQRADSLLGVADVANDSLEKTISQVSRQRLTTLALSLTIESQKQQEQFELERAALLARQAWLFNEKYGGGFEEQVYEALRTSLNALGERDGKNLGGPTVMRLSSGVRALAVSPDGKYVFTGGEDGSVSYLELMTKDTQRFLSGDNRHKAGVRAMLFNSKTNSLITAGDDNAIMFWQFTKDDNLRRKATSDRHENRVWALAQSADFQTLASAGASGKILLWDTAKPNTKLKKTFEHESRVRALAFSAQGDQLASAGDDGVVKLWNTQTGDASTFQNDGKVNALHFVAEDSVLMTGGGTAGVLRFWRLNDPNSEPILRTGHAGPINAIALSPDGRRVATASSDKTIRLWSLEEEIDPIMLQGHESWVWSIAFDPGGETLVTGGGDKTLRFWITRPEILAEKVCGECTRNLAREEWATYVGVDIPYERACPDLPGPNAQTGSN